MPDGSCSISDIQDYFEFIFKKHETLADYPAIKIYPNKTKNRIVFKVKAGYKLELLSSETMKLLGSTKKDVDKDNAEFQSIQVWFTDQNKRPFEIEDSVNITLIIGKTL